MNPPPGARAYGIDDRRGGDYVRKRRKLPFEMINAMARRILAHAEMAMRRLIRMDIGRGRCCSTRGIVGVV